MVVKTLNERMATEEYNPPVFSRTGEIDAYNFLNLNPVHENTSPAFCGICERHSGGKRRDGFLRIAGASWDCPCLVKYDNDELTIMVTELLTLCEPRNVYESPDLEEFLEYHANHIDTGRVQDAIDGGLRPLFSSVHYSKKQKQVYRDFEEIFVKALNWGIKPALRL